MPRADWSAALESRGCEFVKDAEGFESGAELWRSPGGVVFLVPYVVIPEEDERRVADYSLKKDRRQARRRQRRGGRLRQRMA